MSQLTQIILARMVGDIDGAEYQTGSLYRDGNVPNMNFNSNYGEVNVNWYNPDNANSNLRSREVVLAKTPKRGL